LKTSPGRVSGRCSEAPRSGCEADCVRIREEGPQGDGDEIRECAGVVRRLSRSELVPARDERSDSDDRDHDRSGVEEARADPAEDPEGEPKSSTNSSCVSARVRFLGLGTPRGVIWDDCRTWGQQCEINRYIVLANYTGDCPSDL